MLSDIKIAQSIRLKKIKEIAASYGVPEDSIELYGDYKAKIKTESIKQDKKGKIVLVTAISPTPAGEGKTTVNVGLSQALNKLGYNAVSALREPSLGPSFGMKGGAAGGGYSQVLPMEDINLHFTGDMHAITYANNLIAALLDNYIHQGNELNIDPKSILWKRCLDLNDRSLREIITSMGARANGVMRADGFNITVASEIMAILCLSENIEELKENISNILLGFTYDKKPIFVRDIKAEESATILLKDAIKPNLVQTTENTLAIIHGGPFANIAHGCNSINATKIGSRIADYVVTEAGFGADLGAEKFCNIKCRLKNISPDVIVIVATVKALKMHGGIDKGELSKENLNALEKGFLNLKRHIENMKKFGENIVVAINKFPTDTNAELELLVDLAGKEGVPAHPVEIWSKGGAGGLELAKTVVKLSETDNDFKLLYEDSLSIKEKIERVAKEIYRAENVVFSKKAQNKLKLIDELGFNAFPVCMAKTQYSFSDDPKLLGAPEGFELNISDININSGAGFIVALTGEILTMPGLPKVPAAMKMSIDKEGTVDGLF